jgi:hypothetical protein
MILLSASTQTGSLAANYLLRVGVLTLIPPAQVLGLEQDAQAGRKGLWLRLYVEWPAAMSPGIRSPCSDPLAH